MTGMVRDMEPDAGAHEGGGRRRLCHRDRSRRLAGAHAEDAVPRGPSHHRPHRRARRRQADLPLHKLPLAEMQKIEPKITQAVFDVLSVERSVGEPHQLRRHRAEERARAGPEMAEDAGARPQLKASMVDAIGQPRK